METLQRIHLTKLVYLLPIMLYFVACTEYPIGAIFDRNSVDIKYAFEKQIDFLNNQRDGIELRQEIQVLESTDSFAVSNAICSLLKKGVYGIIGVSDASALSTIQSYSNTFQVPFLSLSMTQNSTNHGAFQLFMRPVYISGLLDVIISYDWDRILYIYDTDEGLIRLQQLFQAVNAREHTIDIDVKRVDSVQDCYQTLKDLHKKDEKANIRVFLDIPTEDAENVIILLKNDTNVMNHKFHFLLGELRIEEMDYENNFRNGGINITGFQMLNYTRLLKKNTLDKEWTKWEWPDARDSVKIPLEPAIAIDAVDLFLRALKQLDKRYTYRNYNMVGRPLSMKNVKCTDNSYVSPNNGTNLMDILKGPEVEFNGLTGKVSFDDKGFRKKFKLHLLDITMNMGLAEVGLWTREAGLRTQEPNRIKSGVDKMDRVRRVTTILEVDLAIAPMTITSQRERVVDFTKPFMSLGISIMIKKTALKKASVFSFMDPLSYEIWMCILFAYIGVSVVLFLVSRFSPTEWHVDEGTSITNDFTISNSLWYSLGAFMQQGCDISPRSVSGRIVGSVWWFFTLIIISSYTANLAAFLTVERMLTPIESAEDLAKQTEIQYGILSSGSTKAFFQQSKFPVHERMWAYMQSASPSVFVKSNAEGIERVRKGNYAYLIESTTNKYTNMRKPCNTMQVGPNLDSKGYGIATPIGSDLRDQLTLAVLKLREAGKLEDMQKDWWDRRSECPKKENNQDGGQAELTLENVAGIFYILATGLSLSVVIAFFEFIYKSKIDSKRSKKPFGSVLRCKARLSFRGSLDRDTPAPNTPLRKSMSTYTYTGPSHVAGADGFPDNLHTQV